MSVFWAILALAFVALFIWVESRRSGRLRSRPISAASLGFLARRMSSSCDVPANFCAWK